MCSGDVWKYYISGSHGDSHWPSSPHHATVPTIRRKHNLKQSHVLSDIMHWYFVLKILLRKFFTRYTSQYMYQKTNIMFQSFFENVKFCFMNIVCIATKCEILIYVHKWTPCTCTRWNHKYIHCSIALKHMQYTVIIKILNFSFSQIKGMLRYKTNVLTISNLFLKKYYIIDIFHVFVHCEIWGVYILQRL